MTTAKNCLRTVVNLRNFGRESSFISTARLLDNFKSLSKVPTETSKKHSKCSFAFRRKNSQTHALEALSDANKKLEAKIAPLNLRIRKHNLETLLFEQMEQKNLLAQKDQNIARIEAELKMQKELGQLLKANHQDKFRKEKFKVSKFLY